MNTKQSNETRQASAFDPDTWDEDAHNYFNNVDFFWKEGYNYPFRNGRPLHAAYLTHKFLSNAESCIRLYSGELIQTVGGGIDQGMPFYSDTRIIDAFKTFLAKNRSELKILLEKKVDVEHGQAIDDHPLVSAIRAMTGNGEDMKGHVEIRQVRPEVLKRIKEAGDGQADVHMLLMDNHAFRLEFNTEDKSAYVNLNDRKLTEKLTNFFDNVLSDQSKQLWQWPDDNNSG